MAEQQRVQSDPRGSGGDGAHVGIEKKTVLDVLSCSDEEARRIISALTQETVTSLVGLGICGQAITKLYNSVCKGSLDKFVRTVKAIEKDHSFAVEGEVVLDFITDANVVGAYVGAFLGEINQSVVAFSHLTYMMLSPAQRAVAKQAWDVYIDWRHTLPALGAVRRELGHVEREVYEAEDRGEDAPRETKIKLWRLLKVEHYWEETCIKLYSLSGVEGGCSPVKALQPFYMMQERINELNQELFGCRMYGDMEEEPNAKRACCSDE